MVFFALFSSPAGGSEGERFEELYRAAVKEARTDRRRRAAFYAAALALGFALFLLHQSGYLGRLPFASEIPFLAPSDEQIIANLSELYGNVEAMTVKGDSMFPYLVDRQKVFVATDYYKSKANQPQRDDVVAVSFSTIPGQYVKRIVFVPQDSIAQEGNTFYVKDSAYNKTVVLSPGDILYGQIVGYGYAVPNGTVVVLGDNPQDSVDSRRFGLVLVSELSGKVVRQ